MSTISYTREITVTKTYDIIVCGAGPAGICAAVAAARQGAKVALVERYGIPGGNLTAGHVGPILGAVSNGTMRDEVCELLGVRDNDMDGTTGVAHDMELARIALTEFINHDNIDVYLQTVISDAWVENDTIKGVIISTKEGLQVLGATVVIDATGDGDVAYFAGCEFEKGRDDGLMQPVTLEFTLDNVVEEVGIHCIGDIDDVQFKGQRFLDWCKQQADAGILPKNAAAVRLHPTVYKGSRQVNTTQANGFDSTKLETIYDAELELRRQIKLLQNFFRENLPGYENCKIVGSACTTGIRESRRVMGEYVITAEELASGKRFDDVIVHKADFLVDIHNPAGSGQAEKNIQWCIPYDLPYRCFVPKKIEGLYTAGRCISVTDDMWDISRVIPPCAVTGEAAGTAAAMCDDFSALDVDALRRRLQEQGVRL